LKKALLFIITITLLQSNLSYAQKDSLVNIEEVVVKGFESNTRLQQVPASISILGKSDLQRNSNYSLLPAFNNVSGVRMEERSPGSYRLSIRGSLLRSPFGVRNVKLYLDDFIFTDAGGNAYLNLLDNSSVSSAEIIKGPAGSIYGAGTGGAVLFTGNALMAESKKDTSSAQIKLSAGSFNTVHQSVQWQKNTSAYNLSILQNHSQSDGYRDQSENRHLFFSFINWV